MDDSHAAKSRSHRQLRGLLLAGLPVLALLVYLFEPFGLWHVPAPHKHGGDERPFNAIVTEMRRDPRAHAILGDGNWEVDHSSTGWNEKGWLVSYGAVVTSLRGKFYLTAFMNPGGAGWVTSIFLTDGAGRRYYLTTPRHRG